MKKISDLLSHLNKKAPLDLTETWDNTGLLIGSKLWSFAKAVISTDLSLDCLNRAKESGSGLIVVHHPPIFPKAAPMNSLTDSTNLHSLKSLIFQLLQEKISLICLHSNFDKGSETVAVQIAEALQLKISSRIAPDDRGFGYGFIADSESKLDEKTIFQKIKELFRVEALRFTPALKESDTNKFAYSPGSGSGFVSELVQNRPAWYLTGELSYHEALRLARSGCHVIELGHEQSEYFFAPTVQNWLQEFGVAAEIYRPKFQQII